MRMVLCQAQVPMFLAVFGVLALVGLTVSAEPANTACAQPESVFVSTGEHGERVFSDTPASGDESELALGCARASGEPPPQSSAEEMLELALVLAEDRRAESAQRRADQQVRDERRALALDRAAQEQARVTERRWVDAYPYRVGGRQHHYPHQPQYRPHQPSHSPAYDTPEDVSDTPEPAPLSKRFPTR